METDFVLVGRPDEYEPDRHVLEYECDGPKDVLTEAHLLIRGDRQRHYGPPSENLARIAALWTAYLDTEVTANDVCALMILLKQARGRAGYDRDNSVDTAGYAGLQEILNNERGS